MTISINGSPRSRFSMIRRNHRPHIRTVGSVVYRHLSNTWKDVSNGRICMTTSCCPIALTNSSQLSCNVKYFSGFTDHGEPVIVVGTTPYKYTYNITHGGNVNERTIQRFSIDANVRMRPGSNSTRDYYDTFQPYVDYYGDYAYADKLILAGLNGRSVTLNNKAWNFNFLDFDGRAGKQMQRPP